MTGRKLSLSTARRGNIFITQDGRDAVYIGRDMKLKRPYIFRVGGDVWTRRVDGTHCHTCDGNVYPAIIKRKGKAN